MQFTAFGENRSTGLLTLHIGASFSYIAIEARDSLFFSRIAKRPVRLTLFCFQLQINLKSLLTVAFPRYLDIAESLFLLCLHNHLMYIMPYHWNIKQMCGCLNQLNTKSGLNLQLFAFVLEFDRPVCLFCFLACGVFPSELKNLEIRMNEGRRQHA